ncbi:MAG: hypothetical protein ACXWW8_03165 [Solirubrobacterales bacterium]
MEWVALLLLVALLLAGLLQVTGARLPGATLTHSIAARLICAAQLSSCRQSVDSPLAEAYGEDTAVLVRRYAPELRYERGMTALPVDFRHCRSPACADGSPAGLVWRSLSGQPATAFVHVIRRGGNTYLQYWLYYPNSATYRGVPVAGRKGFHLDDWESFQVRTGAKGAGIDARASSHHGYGGGGGALGWASDGGIVRRPGWNPARGKLLISGGSHAGRPGEAPSLVQRLQRISGEHRPAYRWTPASRLRLVPIERLARSCERADFAISAPWCKRVYLDPEYTGTD